MLKKINSALILLGLFWGLTSFVMPVKAESQNNFSISPLNPETGQPQSTYYDLSVKPNEEKEIKVRLFNSNSQDLTVNVTAKEATTNDNGVISYAGQEKKETSLKVPFSSLAKVEAEQVVIPKNGSRDVAIRIKVPAQTFEGIILGGIRVTAANQDNRQATASVKANVAYSVAVLLREETKEIAPSMHLLGVKKEVRNYRNYVSAHLQNTAPRLIKKLETKASIYKKGSMELLYETQKSEMEMAPQSSFNFGVSLEDHSLSPGKYLMKVSGKADGKPYYFEESFEVSPSEAKKYDENAVYASHDSSSLWLILAGVLLMFLFLLLGCFIVIYERRKPKKEGHRDEEA